MIQAYHLIFGAYGFWLPNDPRGSWSDFIGSWDLFRYGGPTKSKTRHEDDRTLRYTTKTALKYPAVRFTGIQARAVARGFARCFERTNTPVWACAILPDHVHLVVGRPRMLVEQLVIQLKGQATRQLESEGIHPLARWKTANNRVPKCWARGEWKVFLDTNDIERAVRYVGDNPVKEGKRRQNWGFVGEVGNGAPLRVAVNRSVSP